MFAYTTAIRVRDTDAGGVLFFARYLALAHDAYEAFMDAHGVNVGRELLESDHFVAVVHTECEHRAPLWAGETVTIALAVERVRRRAFTLTYAFHKADGTLACRARTTHAVIDKAKRRAVPLPQYLERLLQDAADTDDAPESA